MQYFLMTAFCWMLIEGIYLYFFVVKVYNINTKMYMYHVISWGDHEFIVLKHALVTCTGNCNHAFGSPNLVLPCNELFPFPSFLYGQVFHWSWWPCHLASLLEKKGYKAIRVITSKKKIQGFLLALLLLISCIWFSVLFLHIVWSRYHLICWKFVFLSCVSLLRV